MTFDQLKEQYQLDGHYPSACRSCVNNEWEDDLGIDFADYAARSLPEPRLKPISRAEHDRIVRRYHALQHELDLYHESGDHNYSGHLTERHCPICGPVMQIMYWQGRCYKCISRELAEAGKAYRNLRHYKVV